MDNITEILENKNDEILTKEKQNSMSVYDFTAEEDESEVETMSEDKEKKIFGSGRCSGKTHKQDRHNCSLMHLIFPG
ncbi:hypothetical protein KUTeg_013776 [Tegillarca granosa]|uniref:Uncharacterized protein n=1 Tax=Tegillarca granosa TaxID=220873 RepID=A0ABQ9EUP0_TEGGR|nr:hypothetical protein KUTeg_013776 [Tegillarca granosa]